MIFVPLQFGVPGATEFLIIIVFLAIIGIFAGRWIYRDATSRGSSWAWQWAVGIVFLFILGFVPGLIGLGAYLLVRGEKLDAAD